MTDGDSEPPASTWLSTSPCVGICELGDDDRCTGCRRSRDELAGWASFTPEQRDAINRANWPKTAPSVRRKLLGQPEPAREG